MAESGFSGRVDSTGMIRGGCDVGGCSCGAYQYPFLGGAICEGCRHLAGQHQLICRIADLDTVTEASEGGVVWHTCTSTLCVLTPRLDTNHDS